MRTLKNPEWTRRFESNRFEKNHFLVKVITSVEAYNFCMTIYLNDSNQVSSFQGFAPANLKKKCRLISTKVVDLDCLSFKVTPLTVHFFKQPFERFPNVQSNMEYDSVSRVRINISCSFPHPVLIHRHGKYFMTCSVSTYVMQP